MVILSARTVHHRTFSSRTQSLPSRQACLVWPIHETVTSSVFEIFFPPAISHEDGFWYLFSPRSIVVSPTHPSVAGAPHISPSPFSSWQAGAHQTPKRALSYDDEGPEGTLSVCHGLPVSRVVLYHVSRPCAPLHLPFTTEILDSIKNTTC